MSNIIQIKHGTGVPDNKLAPYELGYMDDSGHLYIGGAYEDAEAKTYGAAKALNYLPLDKNGYIPALSASGNLTFNSAADNPKLMLKSANYTSKVGYALRGVNGRAYILEYPPDSSHYERYNLPEPSTTLADDITYEILTSKGGTFAGDFVFSGNITANGVLIVDSSSYGTEDPNTAKVEGSIGQLYFVLTE